MEAPLGWSQPPPSWVQELCPTVVQHFDRFPNLQDLVPYPPNVDSSSSNNNNKGTRYLPWFSTLYHARAVCTLHILQERFARPLNVDLLLYAGTHMGALVHGQPIPWDDDIDLAVSVVEFTKLRRVVLGVNNNKKCHVIHQGTRAKLCARLNYNALKVWVDYHDNHTNPFVGQPAKRAWKSPFLDIFAYHRDNDHGKPKVVELRRAAQVDQVVAGKYDQTTMAHLTFPASFFFPTNYYYFAGLWVLAPSDISTLRRYDATACVSPIWDHRRDEEVRQRILDTFGSAHLDCCRLSTRFPFRQFAGLLSNGRTIFQPTMPRSLERTVNCGGHYAATCGACGGPIMCNGKCRWNQDEMLCLSKNTVPE